MNLNFRTANVTRYITSLCEGESLPAFSEADDDFKYVLKSRSTGYGVKTLIDKFLGLPVPELVL